MNSVLGRITVGDGCIMVLLLVAALAAWLLARGSAGATVIVEQEGRVVFTAPLHSDCRGSLPGPEGPTVLLVEEGAVRVGQSSCPNHFCQRQGAISKSGEAVVCLPNRLLVRIVGPPSTMTDYDFLTH
jgi:hypothetical protein